MFCNYCRASNPDDGLYCSRCGRSLKTIPSSAGSQTPLRDAPTEMMLPVGTLLMERYRIIRELGAGGMGRVYEARDEKLDMPVAIKVLRDILSRDPGSVKRLMAEARHSMLLSHANIVRVHNFEDGPTVKFLVMEYVEGETLAHRVSREGKIPEEETRKIALEICRGLQHAHGKKIIHRDLKPGNILLGKDGAIKVADFGIARLCRDSVSRLTAQHDSGTLLYMSPEQLDGESGEASDVYSLGVVLYEMLSGDPPFVTGEVTAQIRHKDPRQIEGVSDDLNRIVLKCLEKKPENRFANLQELSEAIEGRAGRSRPSEAGQEQYLSRLRARGTRAFDDRKYADAIELWEEALAFSPGDTMLMDAVLLARKQLADAEKKEAERKRAEEEAERQRKAEIERKQRFESLKAKGNAAADAGNFEQAFSFWEEALELNPGDAELKATMSAAQQRVERERLETGPQHSETEEAAAALKQWVDSILAQVDSMMNQGNCREAEQHLLQALAYVPDHALLTERLALCRQQLNAAAAASISGPAEKAAPRKSRLKRYLALAATVVVLVAGAFIYLDWKDRQERRSFKPPAFGGDTTSTAASNVPPETEPPAVDKPAVSKPATEIAIRTEVGAGNTTSRSDAADRIARGFESFFRADEPPPNPTVGTTWTSAVDGREMTWIPPGSFIMGSPYMEFGRAANEIPHQLIVQRGFWMDTSEVTNEAFQQFVLANPKWQKNSADVFSHDGHYLDDWNGNQYPAGRGKYPVLAASWYAAQAYAQWAGKRLPSEAEWEYACRAGTSTAFWWGDVFNAARANNGHVGTVAAGDPMRRNPWGLYDMAGNVGEWTSSLYLAYPYRSNDGRENLQATGNRVIRGGSWNTNVTVLRAASRDGNTPSFCAFSVGFRCAR
jgi:formylglycine-generating enzyme required for sulfatase activity/tetratricopeptide (TPR) repeat protein